MSTSRPSSSSSYHGRQLDISEDLEEVVEALEHERQRADQASADADQLRLQLGRERRLSAEGLARASTERRESDARHEADMQALRLRLQEAERQTRKLHREHGHASSGEREPPVELPMHSQQKLLADVNAAREEIAKMSELLRQATAESQDLRKHNAQLEDRIAKLEGNQESCRLCRDRAVRSGIDKLTDRASSHGDTSAQDAYGVPESPVEERPQDVEGVGKDRSPSPERTVARGGPRPWTAGNHSLDRTKQMHGQAAVPFTNLELTRLADSTNGDHALTRNRPVSAAPKMNAAMRTSSSEREKKSSEDTTTGVSNSTCSTRASTRHEQRTPPPVFAPFLTTTTESARPTASPDFIGDSGDQLDLDADLVEADLAGQGGRGRAPSFTFPMSPSPDIATDAEVKETPARSPTPLIAENASTTEAQQRPSAWDATAEIAVRPMSPVGDNAQKADVADAPAGIPIRDIMKTAHAREKLPATGAGDVQVRKASVGFVTPMNEDNAESSEGALASSSHDNTDKDAVQNAPFSGVTPDPLGESKKSGAAAVASSAEGLDESQAPASKPKPAMKEGVKLVSKWYQTIHAARKAEEYEPEGLEAVAAAAHHFHRVAAREALEEPEEGVGFRRYGSIAGENVGMDTKNLEGFLRQDSDQSHETQDSVELPPDDQRPRAKLSARPRKGLLPREHGGTLGLGTAEIAAQKLISMLQRKEAERLKKVQSPEEKFEQLDTQLQSWRALRDAAPQPLLEAHSEITDFWDNMMSKRLQRDRYNFQHVFRPPPPDEPPPDLRPRERVVIRTPQAKVKQMARPFSGKRIQEGEFSIMDPCIIGDDQREGTLLLGIDSLPRPRTFTEFEHEMPPSLLDVFRNRNSSSVMGQSPTDSSNPVQRPRWGRSQTLDSEPDSPQSPKSTASDRHSVRSLLVPEKPEHARHHGHQWSRPQSGHERRRTNI
mmetsp:Transcript_81563/g.149287  ORF Transcript_81563/g.149287 Transcript_81563/m.149287 type:complete len:947 (-) Transcript_81563:125-2965(-)